jgi:hypothetical protein
MTKYFVLTPECPGSLGNDSKIVDLKANPMQLLNFQFMVERWPEDDLLEAASDGYAVTEPLAKVLKASDLTGFELGEIDIQEGDQLFLDRYDRPGEALPALTWLKVTGVAGQDDFGLRHLNGAIPLVVSERALAVLKAFKINNCIIEEYQNPLVRG